MQAGNSRVIALGFFDGVHCGHGALLTRTWELARSCGAVPSCLTFDRRPAELLGQHMPLINTAEDRAALMHSCYGIRDVLTMTFDEALMHTPWEQFADRLLREYGAVHLVCGENFRFGDRAEGTPEKLRAYCAAHGIGCDIVSPVIIDGAPASSTRIRALLEGGRFDDALRLLGHPHRLSGVVQHGKHLGSKLGFPTANLRFPAGVLVPAHGVYAAVVTLPGGLRRIAVTNIGLRPTVENVTVANCEPWILDYDGDLYGKHIQVEFTHYLRPEQRFDGLDALRAQIMRDADAARRCLEGCV